MSKEPITNTTPASTDTPSPVSSREAQLGYAYAQASKKKDKAGMEKALRDALHFSMQNYLIGQGRESLAEFAKVSPGLIKALAEKIQEGGIDAFTKMLELQNEANKKKQVMYQDQIDRMYQSRLGLAEGPAKLMNTFKGFALLIQAACGVDLSKFIAECDKRIQEEYAKVPAKDIEGLSSINAYTVDPREASKIIHAMSADAQRIADSAPEKARKANNAATAQAGGVVGTTNTPTATESTPAASTTPAFKPVGTKFVVDAMADLIAEKNLITTDKGRAGIKAELQKDISAAAGVDGDAKTVSGKDIGALALQTENAIKLQGGQPISAETAKALAAQAIERARALELAAPAPRP